MGYIFTYTDSVACESWQNSRQFHRVKENQKRLLTNLLNPHPYDSILDIGCGTGAAISFLSDHTAFQLSGVDPSPYMLDVARQRLGNRVDLYRAPAEDLPFDDNSFNHATIVTSLEFVADPEKAIAEAARVAKDRLFIGFVNRYAFGGLSKGASAVLEKTTHDKANFFTISEIKSLVRSVVGNVPLSWRATNLMRPASGIISRFFENNSLSRKFPFGPYIGVVVTLVPTYRVRPLPLKIAKKGTPEMAGGHLSTVKKENAR